MQGYNNVQRYNIAQKENFHIYQEREREVIHKRLDSTVAKVGLLPKDLIINSLIIH